MNFGKIENSTFDSIFNISTVQASSGPGLGIWLKPLRQACGIKSLTNHVFPCTFGQQLNAHSAEEVTTFENRMQQETVFPKLEILGVQAY